MLNQVELKLLEIEMELESKNYDSAIYSLSKFLEGNYSPDAIYLLSKIAFLNNHIDVAKNLIIELIVEYPNTEKYIDLFMKIRSALQEKELLRLFEKAHNDKDSLCILKYGYQLLKYQNQPLKTHMILSETLFSMGKARLAHSHVLKALEFAPNNKDLLGNMVSYLHYTYDSSSNEVKHYAEIYGEKAFPEYKGKEYKSFRLLDLNEKKKLRIGFISGDFKSHVISLWIGNLFPKLQENELEIFCYCNNEKDHVTDTWIQRSNYWREIKDLNDREAANLIYEDRINILIDLSGHTTLNRLGVIALRPAPIQVCYLGNTSPIGLKTLDYTLSDVKHVRNETEAGMYLEKIYRLPYYASSFNLAEAFNPNQEGVAAPYKENGFITFGCLNNMIKLNTKCFDTWIKILKSVPNSKLYLCNHALQHDDMQRYVRSYFHNKNIGKEQLILEAATNKNRNEYLSYFHKIDIYLDSFPLGAGTTCIDTVFMGVPIISLRGERILHRMSAEILNTLNHEELVTENSQDYINKAIDLSRSYSRLDHYRNHLREDLLCSKIVDAASFAKDFTTAMKSMWNEFCEKEQN